MNKIHFLNSSAEYVNQVKESLPEMSCRIYEKSDIDKIKSNITLDENVPLYNDYLRLYILYKYGGLVIDGNFKFYSSLNLLLKNDMFLAYKTENEIATNIIWSKGLNNEVIKRIMDEIELNPTDNITSICSKVFDIKLYNKKNMTVCTQNNSYIYSYDFFYPLDYEKHGKQFSENTKAVFYEDKVITQKQKLRLKLFIKYGASSVKYIDTLVDILRNKVGAKKYSLMQKVGIRDISKKKQEESINKAIDVLDAYKATDYVIFHNPRWLGVTFATKELFTNLVPLEELSNKKDAQKIAQKIVSLNISQVIFSAFTDGWSMLAYELKRLNPNIKLKSFWHGSHSQVIEQINWRTNLELINLHKEDIIDVFGTCKESLLNMYKSQNYNVFFLKNTVKLDKEFTTEVLRLKDKNNNTGVVKIGLYSAGNDWRKNMYSQIAASSLIDGAIVEMVPLSFDAELFAGRTNLELVGINHSVKREELLKKLAGNDINLYVTFSECAPMSPIESMEVGTICLTGNNHHYFTGTKLEEFLVVSREDDVLEIANMIKKALDNKEKIFELYRSWKIEYDIESKNSVKEFLAL